MDKLEISRDLWFEHQEYCEPSITYINRSPDPWYSDDEIDIDLDEKKAKEIIEWLKDKFSL